MKIYEIITRNGKYVSIGSTEHEAKINFTIEFPFEKIRDINEVEGKALQIETLS